MKFNCKLFVLTALFGGAFLGVCQPASAVSEAGEIQRKSEHKPKGNLYVTNNILDVDTKVPEANEATDEPVNFSADEMINDDKADTVMAKGNVEVDYNNMHLETDELIYDRQTDVITARGNVRLFASDGSIVYGQEVSLADKMSIGEMHFVKAMLKDKSLVTAKRFRKKDNNTKVMYNATYTACDICEGKKPLWLVSARKVQHDEIDQNMNYNDAVVHIKGVPVFYTPFLSHPDPTVKRRSGFMMPTIGSSNYLGALFQPRYFWAVNDQTNVFLAPIFSSDKDPVLMGSYKQYFYNAYTSIDASFLKDNEGKRNKNRGHLFASGLYDINDYWRMSYDLKYVSDYVYLKDLSLPYEDDAWLNSEIKFERFNGRNYASIEAFYYKMLSYNLHRGNANQYRAINSRKPFVAPLVEAEIYSDPNKYGAYFKTNLSTASVYHQNGSETQRVTSINSWELPMTSRFGEKYRFVASLKSDAYYINRYQYMPNNSYTGTTARFFPQMGMEWRLPFVRATETSRQILEPVVVGVIAPNGNNKTDKIPNEDSADVYYDDTNVLDLNRYAGYDRNDTGSRVSYGLRWSTYGNIIGRTSSFIAQTYEKSRNSSFLKNLDNDDKSHFSDLVGRINAEPNQYWSLDYRFRLDKKTLDAKYSELGTTIGPNFLRATASYIFLQGNTYYNDLYSERKELYTSLATQISQNWTASIYNLRDLTARSKGNLEHGGTVSYEDECFKWDTVFKKYNSSNPDLKNDYEVGMTFYLKTLGSFGS